MKTFPDSIPAPPHRRRPVWGICFCRGETSPTSSPRSMPPLLVGEALAFRDVFQQTQISFIENETSLPRAPTLGELAPQASERASPVKLLQRRCDTMALTSRVRIAVCLALWQHPCPLRLLRRHLSQSERLWHSVTFSGKRKSVSSKTRPLCQGLSCQESCRADARLRGWTKDAFRLSGERRCCSVQPLRHGFASLDATSPSRGGFGIP